MKATFLTILTISLGVVFLNNQIRDGRFINAAISIVLLFLIFLIYRFDEK